VTSEARGSLVPSRATPIRWRLATVADVVTETPRARTLVLDVSGWPGHRAGQHVDVRLTAEDGYQAERSYSIASAPEDARIALTVERLDDGEVSPYLTDVVQPGDQLQLRGPIGGYFIWDVGLRGPLLLVAGGSGIVPLMAMLRHRAAALKTADLRTGHDVPARLLYSSRRWDDVFYRSELTRLAEDDETLDVALGGPLLLVAGGSGIVPLMAMLRHRAAALEAADARARHNVPTRRLY